MKFNDRLPRNETNMAAWLSVREYACDRV